MRDLDGRDRKDLGLGGSFDCTRMGPSKLSMTEEPTFAWLPATRELEEGVGVMTLFLSRLNHSRRGLPNKLRGQYCVLARSSSAEITRYVLFSRDPEPTREILSPPLCRSNREGRFSFLCLFLRGH